MNSISDLRFLFFKNFFKKNIFFIFLFFNSFFLVFLDLYSKSFVKKLIFNKCYFLFLNQYKYSLFYKCKISIASFIKLVYVKNYGMIFGSFSDFKLAKYFIPFFIAIPSFFILYLFYSTYKNENLSLRYKKIQMFLLSLILSGGIGNIADRLYNGYVFDFIDVYYGKFHWYAFNLADCFICIGIFSLILFDLAINSKRFLRKA